jgi:hypothetical protein
MHSPRFQNAHDFPHRTVRVKHVLQYVLGDEHIKRTVREGKVFQVLTQFAVLACAGRNAFQVVGPRIAGALDGVEIDAG